MREGLGVGEGGWGRAGEGLGSGEGGAVPACLICGKLVAVFHLCSRTYTQANMSYLSLLDSGHMCQDDI